MLMHPDDLQTAEAGLRHSLRTGESFAMRFRIRRADGVYRWTDQRVEPRRRKIASGARGPGRPSQEMYPAPIIGPVIERRPRGCS